MFMVFKCSVPDNWTVEPAIFYMGNKYHPCAVLVPLDDDIGRDIIRHVVDMGVAVAGFCKTANIGLEKVVCNVLANPNIRWIIVAGHENPGHRSGKAIVMLSRYGVDLETRRIMCGDRPCKDIPTGYLPNIPLYAIERFRRQVKVVDILIDGKEVTEENVLELTCMAVYGAIQEPKNMIKMHIKGTEYRLFDPGAFDSKPFKVTITGKECLIESIGEDHVFIRAYDLESLEKELRRVLKNNINKNIVIVYGKSLNMQDLRSRDIVECNNLIMIVEVYESQVVIRGLFTDKLSIKDLFISVKDLEKRYSSICPNVYMVLNVPELVDDL